MLNVTCHVMCALTCHIIHIIYTHTPHHIHTHTRVPQSVSLLQHTVLHLQHTATHCNTLQHTATHGNTRQHTTTHCNTLQHTATPCNTLHDIMNSTDTRKGSDAPNLDPLSPPKKNLPHTHHTQHTCTDTAIHSSTTLTHSLSNTLIAIHSLQFEQHTQFTHLFIEQ